MKVIIFDKHGAKISRWPRFLHLFNRKNIVIVRHIDHLKEIPMIFWKKSGQNIIEMSRPEKLERLEKLEKGS